MEDGMKIVSDRWMLQSQQIVNAFTDSGRIKDL